LTDLHIHHTRLTPQMRSVLERMARAGHAPLHTRSPQDARVAYEAGAGVLEVPKATLARVEDLHIPARDGHAMAARLYAPSTDAGLPLLLYMHGGGFTIGSIATHDILCRELARLAGCMVVSLDYRLAPEHRFPAASNDAWDALQWLASHAETLRADPARLAVGGDSAGGTLAAVNAILARDAGLPLALQLLFYPGCAAHQDTPSHATFARGLVLEEPAISWFFGNYVQSRAEREDWRFAPLHAPDVDGVAPPGSAWPNVTRWWTRAWTTPTNCAWPVCRWTLKSTAA
jgi:acetyl esterase